MGADSLSLRMSRIPPQPESLADPFGVPGAMIAALAPRCADLNDRTVVLFNNSKLDPAWGHLYAIYDVLEEALRARFARVRLFREQLDLLGPTLDPVLEGRRLIERHQPAAVALALADVGVSQRTLELARLL